MARAVKRTREEQLKIKREKERQRRERIREDPVKRQEQKKKEHEKYLNQRERRIKKTINEMTPRQQRLQRKKWRINTKNYRLAKKFQRDIENKMLENTPPESSDEEFSDRRDIQRQRMSNRRRIEKHREKNSFLSKISELQRKLNKYRQKCHRMKKIIRDKKSKVKSPSPNSTTTSLLNDIGCSPSNPNINRVRKKIMFGEVIERQLKESYKVSDRIKTRIIIKQIMSGNIIKKYKMKRFAAKAIRFRNVSSNKNIPDCRKKVVKFSEIRNKIINFLNEDINSIIFPGKRDFIKKRNICKQKRYLTNTLKNLHQSFLNTYPELRCSYAFFCKNKPFWVIPQKVVNRDTCMCTIHANMNLIVESLFNNKVVQSRYLSKILEKLCCDTRSELCLFRQCNNCNCYKIEYNTYMKEKQAQYYKWTVKKETFFDKKSQKKKISMKTSKWCFNKPLGELVSLFETDLIKFMSHEGRIIHQYEAIRLLKKNLSTKALLIHCDFSENYNLKYAQETQSFHFGGSRQQITLHTVVVYSKGDERDLLKPISYCSLSESLKHNAPAIWAHLLPIIEQNIKNKSEVHFLSDGPSAQYRNKSMFCFLANVLQKMFPNILRITWNYHEAGHGKGAPDGIGGVCKRTADRIVAEGKDVNSFEKLFSTLKDNCPGIQFYKITDEDINKIESTMKNIPVQVFKGTMKVHQVVVSENSRIWFRKLSCFKCDTECSDFGIGKLEYTVDRTNKVI